MLETPEFKSEYLEFDSDLRRRQSITGCVVALFLVPLGGLLDFIVYPEYFVELLKIRFACSCLVGVICLLHFYSKSRKIVLVLNIAWPIAISLAISLMINVVGGISGPYYAGLNLVILGASLLLPLTLTDTLIIVLLTGLSYSVTNLGSSASDINYSLLFNNSFFMFATGIICCTSSYFRSRLRMREFSLRYELNQRNQKLAEMDRVKSDFYANISHELRTPLTLILAPVEDLLADSKLEGKIRTQLSYVKENTYRLLKLVNDLLDVMKLEEKRHVLERQPIQINSILRNIIAGMEPLAVRKVVGLSYISEDDSASMLGDASAVEKILINLINNALKFTESGGSVSVRLWAEDELVLVKVTDTGVGISAGDLPSIFDRFHQVDSSATRKHQGTGLGLALVKELTELQGGEVQVESSPGEGTTMIVQFPLLKLSNEQLSALVVEDALAQDSQNDSIDTLHRAANFSIAEPQSEEYQLDSDETNAENEFVGAKLLIVEDEPDVRNYLADSLASVYKIDVALDGEEGLQKIRENKPDLVLLDLMLPKMDGLSVCAEAKKDPECRNTKIMLLTARSDEQSKITALEHGADDFLTKPFSTIEIKTRLKNLWENSGLQRELIGKNEDLTSALEELTETQGQLVQSEKLNAIGRLAAGLLHEVNNPLNFAFGTFQILEREPKLVEDESISEMMGDIRIGFERIANIVKDLKTFAYPEKTDLEKAFLLRPAAETALRLTSSAKYDAKIQINVDDGLALKGSQSHIVQVFVNLVGNAMDAMKEAGTDDQTISIFVTDHPQNSSRACIHVKDNGPGIPAEKMELIFDPFFTTKDVGAGMGMGLSIASTIIKNHGGQLNVESEEGKFTDFQFDLLKDEVEVASPNKPLDGDITCVT